MSDMKKGGYKNLSSSTMYPTTLYEATMQQQMFVIGRLVSLPAHTVMLIGFIFMEFNYFGDSKQAAQGDIYKYFMGLLHGECWRTPKIMKPIAQKSEPEPEKCRPKSS